MVPNDINLTFSWSERKSSTIATLKPMPKVKGKLLSRYENSFTIKAAKLWNKLPSKLCEISNLNAFRIELDRYLCLFPDCPPIKGYFCQNSNSLLEYNTKSFECVLK